MSNVIQREKGSRSLAIYYSRDKKSAARKQYSTNLERKMVAPHVQYSTNPERKRQQPMSNILVVVILVIVILRKNRLLPMLTSEHVIE